MLSPKLLTLIGETFPLALPNVEDVAHLDVATCGLWWSHNHKIFWMLRFLLFKDFSISSDWRKQRKYEEHACEVEMGCFTPLVFSTSAGTSTICKFFIRLASLLVDKKDVANSVIRMLAPLLHTLPLRACKDLSNLEIVLLTYHPYISI